MSQTAAIILAAGQGKRMHSERAKVLHELAGAPILEYVLDLCDALTLQGVHVVVGHQADAVREGFADRDAGWALQAEQLGTAHAVGCAMPDVGDAQRILVLNGDVPMLRAASVELLISLHRGGVSFISAVMPDPTGYGRVIRDQAGEVRGIVEERDATSEQRLVREINAGIYLIDRELVDRLVPEIDSDNDQGEFYITDIVGLAIGAGQPVQALPVDPDEVIGVNSPAELAALARVAQRRIQHGWIESGVRIVDPSLTYIEKGAEIESGATVQPFTVIRRGARISSSCEVGPFSHLRVGAELRPGAEVGNFVEVKKSTIGERTKAKHLAYIGDAVIGAGSNIGAGTIFANYDGKDKHTTTVGDDAFIGSGTVLVAPVAVGNGSMTGAGAVVTRRHDVPDGVVVVGVPARPLRRPATEEPAP